MLHRLIHHLDTTSIAEIVVRLVGAEEQTGMYLAPTQVALCGKQELHRAIICRWRLQMAHDGHESSIDSAVLVQ